MHTRGILQDLKDRSSRHFKQFTTVVATARRNRFLAVAAQ